MMVDDQTNDPRYLQPPCYHYYENDCLSKGGGHVSCGWGENFATAWKLLFQSETWMVETLKPLLEAYSRNLPKGIWGFIADFSEDGPMFRVAPGNACDGGVSPDTADYPSRRFGSHNVDTEAQTMTLFVLSSLWFSAVTDFVLQTPVDKFAEAVPPDPHHQSSIQWEFKSPHHPETEIL